MIFFSISALWLVVSSLCVFGMPGLALVRLLLPAAPLDQQLAVAPAASIACWSLLWLFGTLLGLSLGPVATWGLLLMALAALLWDLLLPSKADPALSAAQRFVPSALLLAVALVCGGLRLYFWREAVTALGSDGYHHSLVSQLLIDRQQLPNDYRPYAQLVSFSYHYAFHTLVAALHMLTGRDAVELTRSTGQVVTVVGLLPIYGLARHLSGTTRGGLAALLCAGLLSAFPAFFINWSRLTQATALLLLPATLLVTIIVFEAPRAPRRALALAAVLVAALFTAHYLTLVFYLYGLGGLLLTGIWRRVRAGQPLVRWAARSLPLGGGALLLASPWLYRLSRRFVGQVVLGSAEGSANSGYFSLANLGISWESYRYLLLCALLAGLALWVLRQPWVPWLLLWPLGSLVYGNPYWVPLPLPGLGLLDFISALTSCYIPAAVLLGMAWSLLWPAARARGLAASAPLALAALAALAWGVVLQGQLYVPSERYVQQPDLAAARWIAAATPEDAVIMPNCYAWDWSPDYVISADAGGWMPLLADRTSIIPPIIRNLEQPADPGLSRRLATLCKGLRDQPESAAVSDLLRRDDISLIYLGERDGFIDPNRLAALPQRYKLLYHQEHVDIFEVLP